MLARYSALEVGSKSIKKKRLVTKIVMILGARALKNCLSIILFVSLNVRYHAGTYLRQLGCINLFYYYIKSTIF